MALACRKPTELGYSFEVWSERLLAKHIRRGALAQGHPSLAGISPGTVHKILRAQGLRPHRVRYYRERRDPHFEPKMVQVLHIYQQVEWEFEHPEAANPLVARQLR